METSWISCLKKQRTSNAEIVKWSGAIKPGVLTNYFLILTANWFSNRKYFGAWILMIIAIENGDLKHGKCWCKQSSVADFIRNYVKVLDFGASHVSNSSVFRRYKICIVSIFKLCISKCLVVLCGHRLPSPGDLPAGRMGRTLKVPPSIRLSVGQRKHVRQRPDVSLLMSIDWFVSSIF